MQTQLETSALAVKILRLRGSGVLALAALVFALFYLQIPACAQSKVTFPDTAEPRAGGLEEPESPDLTKHSTLYVVGYAHLDTEWRWEYPQVISEYIPKTMHDNFALFEKYPHYIFNFSGANRYRMMKEYYPADFAKLKQYVASGRWFPAGSSMEEGDVNSPSAESILRQFLYGNEFFRREFGKASAEYMLPDCFGFPESLLVCWPTLASEDFPRKSSPGVRQLPSVAPARPKTLPLAFHLTSGFGMVPTDAA